LVIRPRCVRRRLAPTGQTGAPAKRISRSNKRFDFGLNSITTASGAAAPKINTGTVRAMTSEGSTTPPRHAPNTTAATRCALAVVMLPRRSPAGRSGRDEASQVRYPGLGCRRANDRGEDLRRFFGREHDGTKLTGSCYLAKAPNLRSRRDDPLPLAVRADECRTVGHQLRSPGQWVRHSKVGCRGERPAYQALKFLAMRRHRSSTAAARLRSELNNRFT